MTGSAWSVIAHPSRRDKPRHPIARPNPCCFCRTNKRALPISRDQTREVSCSPLIHALPHRSPRRRVGGVVTQRIANPCTPVRFRYSPPQSLSFSHLTIRRTGRSLALRVDLKELPFYARAKPLNPRSICSAARSPTFQRTKRIIALAWGLRAVTSAVGAVVVDVEIVTPSTRIVATMNVATTSWETACHDCIGAIGWFSAIPT